MTPTEERASFGSWRNRVSFENVSHGFVTDLVVQLDEFAFDLAIAPVVLACQAQNQLFDLPRAPVFPVDEVFWRYGVARTDLPEVARPG